jgi:hypothetical protein
LSASAADVPISPVPMIAAVRMLAAPAVYLAVPKLLRDVSYCAMSRRSAVAPPR